MRGGPAVRFPRLRYQKVTRCVALTALAVHGQLCELPLGATECVEGLAGRSPYSEAPCTVVCTDGTNATSLGELICLQTEPPTFNVESGRISEACDVCASGTVASRGVAVPHPAMANTEGVTIHCADHGAESGSVNVICVGGSARLSGAGVCVRYEWRAGPWRACSADCANPITNVRVERTRAVLCHDRVSNATLGELGSGTICEELPEAAPSAKEECTWLPECAPPYWDVGDWRACECNTVQTRSVVECDTGFMAERNLTAENVSSVCNIQAWAAPTGQRPCATSCATEPPRLRGTTAESARPLVELATELADSQFATLARAVVALTPVPSIDSSAALYATLVRPTAEATYPIDTVHRLLRTAIGGVITSLEVEFRTHAGPEVAIGVHALATSANDKWREDATLQMLVHAAWETSVCAAIAAANVTLPGVSLVCSVLQLELESNEPDTLPTATPPVALFVGIGVGALCMCYVLAKLLARQVMREKASYVAPEAPEVTKHPYGMQRIDRGGVRGQNYLAQARGTGADGALEKEQDGKKPQADEANASPAAQNPPQTVRSTYAEQLGRTNWGQHHAAAAARHGYVASPGHAPMTVKASDAQNNRTAFTAMGDSRIRSILGN